MAGPSKFLYVPKGKRDDVELLLSDFFQPARRVMRKGYVPFTAVTPTVPTHVDSATGGVRH